MSSVRRAGVATAVAAAQLALAYRFAVVYRRRAGIPRPQPPRIGPDALGLRFEPLTVASDGLHLPAWFMPARDGAPGPGIVLVHGWESARDRTLPFARFLTAAGFHCLTIDVRGHGANPLEVLPVTVGEFARDAAAAFEALLARPEVTVGAISGHSLGGIGALVAAAADPRVAAVAATSAAADPDRLTRQTFRLARLPIPDPVAYPLAWLTTRVFLRPRGHRVGAVSATAAIRRYRGPVLLAHGDEDVVMPISHLGRLAAARGPRWSDPTRPATELISLAVSGGQHSWLYEFAEYRRAMAEFFSRALGGPHEPRLAGEIAAATPAWRIPDGEGPFTAVEAEPGGFRSLAGIIGPGVRPVEADASG